MSLLTDYVNNVNNVPTFGVKATSPTTAPAPTNTLPKAYTAPVAPKPVQDLSGTYGLYNGTVYNKASNTGLDLNAFTQATGISNPDWSSLKFDTAYKPPAPTLSGSATTTPATLTPPKPIAPAPTGAYTPPNQGTTGVSQGGIIGNLLGIANNETPQVAKARADLKALEETYGTQTANVEGNSGDLSLATGREGILNRLFAAKKGAAQEALTSALTSQGQAISATQGAGSLNAPITNPQTGGLVNPSNNSTVGSTASGANLSALVGSRHIPGQTQEEFYNTQTGKAFGTAQELADFVNQQMPGANATAANVFDILKNSANGTNGGSLNPLNNLTSIAQQVLSGQISPSQAYAMGGTIANWQTVLNQELQRQSGGVFDTSAAQAKYDANQTVQNNQAQQKAAYQQAQQQVNNMTSQFTNLLNTYNLNPSEINVANGVIQQIAANTSDWRYQALHNYANEIATTYAQILAGSGNVTDQVRSMTDNFINQLASGKSIQSQLAALDQQAQAKIAGTQTPSTTGGGTGGNTGGGGGSTLGLF